MAMRARFAENALASSPAGEGGTRRVWMRILLNQLSQHNDRLVK
jgi:hypothetical protein